MSTPLPQEIRELRGAFINHPEARKPIIKSKEPIGDPPKYLDKSERDIWHEIISINPPGILVSSDRMVLEILSRLTAKHRSRADLTGPELSTLVKLLACLGMSPSDRSKVTAGPVKDTNPFTEFTLIKS